ncbi:MAG: hypothetical protein M3N17_05575 [Actinomycetota bacterium]|nr:hypothetical protein [Actinomycetota bacterium]
MGPQAADPAEMLPRAAHHDPVPDHGRMVDAHASARFLEAQAAGLLPGLRQTANPLVRLQIVAGHDDCHGRWLDVCALARGLDERLADLVVDLYCWHGRLVASLHRDALALLPATTARRVLDRYAAELAERTVTVVEALDASGEGPSPWRP